MADKASVASGSTGAVNHANKNAGASPFGVFLVAVAPLGAPTPSGVHVGSSSITPYTVSGSGQVNTTVPRPEPMSDGDILLMMFIISGEGIPTFPAGWSTLQGPSSQTHSESSITLTRYLLWKIASGESGDYLITHSSYRTASILLCITGAASATPVSTNNGGLGFTTTALSVTTPANDSLVCFFQSNWTAFGSGTPPSGTTPPFTERWDDATTILYEADGVLSAAGATGDKSVANVNLNATDPWGAFLVAVGPSGAAPAGQPYRKRTGGIPHMRQGQHSIW